MQEGVVTVPGMLFGTSKEKAVWIKAAEAVIFCNQRTMCFVL